MSSQPTLRIWLINISIVRPAVEWCHNLAFILSTAHLRLCVLIPWTKPYHHNDKITYPTRSSKLRNSRLFSHVLVKVSIHQSLIIPRSRSPEENSRTTSRSPDRRRHLNLENGALQVNLKIRRHSAFRVSLSVRQSSSLGYKNKHLPVLSFYPQKCKLS